jgi:hypothetical protein
MKRVWRVAEQKIVGARQNWRCAACDCLLPSSFQLDHIIPLWNGGANDLSNANCLCSCCHATKTQLESIERADIILAKRAAAVRQAPFPITPASTKKHKDASHFRDAFIEENPFLCFAHVGETRPRKLLRLDR